MPPTIDLEHEFFKAAKNLATHAEAKQQFLARIRQISEEWIEDKFRLGISGLKK